jgi:hypothetical protein
MSSLRPHGEALLLRASAPEEDVVPWIAHLWSVFRCTTPQHMLAAAAEPA